MIYSVYNPTSKTYDYYEGPGPGGTHAGTPPIARGRNALGATPEQASWKVPAGAKRVGRGPVARGRIAELGGLSSFGLGDVGDIAANPLAFAALAVAGYFMYKRMR